MKPLLSFPFLLLQVLAATAQPEMETGGQKMPDEWVDKDTKRKVVRLTRNGRSNLRFYFHNNPFVGNKMVYYSTTANNAKTNQKLETGNALLSGDKQLYLLDLNMIPSERLTDQASPMNGEIVHAGSGNVFYQIKDSVWSVNTATGQNKLVYVFPADSKATVTTVNGVENVYAVETGSIPAIFPQSGETVLKLPPTGGWEGGEEF